MAKIHRTINPLLSGTVKWFNDAKGYGFIQGADGEDVFVHHTAINMEGHRTLMNGQAVTYQMSPTEKGNGKAAENVSAV